MDLRQLRYFVAIADRGSITAAAQALHVAQSALSRHLQHLEDELGGALFERGARGVELSESGKVLLRRARFILQEMDSTRIEVLGQNREVQGAVRLAVPSSISQFLYAPLVERVLSRHPRITLHLSEGLSSLVMDRLLHGGIDLAIMADLKDSEYVAVTPLAHEPMALLGRLGDPVLAEPVVPLSRLFDIPLVVPAAASWIRRLSEMLGQSAPPLQVRVHVDSTAPLKRIVAQGWGYGVLPLSVMSAQDSADGLVARPIEGFAIERTLAIARGRPIGRAVTEVRAAIVELFAERTAGQ